MKSLWLALFLALLGLAPVQAQQVSMPPPAGTEAVLCAFNTAPPAIASGFIGFLQCDANGKLIISGGASSGGGGAAAVGSFAPGGVFATLTAAAASASVALPAGNSVLFFNSGTTTVSCTLGIGSATATANEIQIPANSPALLVVGANTFGACIDQTGSASNLVLLAGGSYLSLTNIGNGTVTATGATGSALPNGAVSIGINDGTTNCAGAGCLIIPQAAPITAAGSSATTAVPFQGVTGGVPVPGNLGTNQGTLLGSYCMSGTSGVMAAGLASASPIFSWRYGGANLAVVRKVSMTVGDTSTAFTAGIFTFNMFAARAFSVNDTGGTASTLTTNNGKLKTSYATTALSDFRTSSTATLSAGTRTLDATQLGGITASDPATAGQSILATPSELFRPTASEQPYVAANNEGFVIQATVPATGTWTFTVNVCWDETTAWNGN